MKKKLHTEKEIVKAQQTQLHTIDKLLQSNALTLEELDSILPGILHLNRADFSLIYMAEDVVGQVGLTQKEYVGDIGAELPAQLLHPITMEIGTIDRFVQQMEQGDTSKVVTNFQFFRNAPDLPYYWIITHTKLVEGKEGEKYFLSISNQLDSMGEMAQKFEKVLESNHFMQQHYRKFASLTKQEVEVLTLIAKGLSRQQIADSLFISVLTYDSHRKNLRKKLEAKNINDLLRYAEAFGLEYV